MRGVWRVWNLDDSSAEPDDFLANLDDFLARLHGGRWAKLGWDSGNLEEQNSS